MTLPAWNSDGLLDPGIHQASMTDVYDRFVLDAPNRPHREALFHALSCHLSLLRRFLPAGARVWVNGGFSTRKAAPPHDVDIAIIPNDAENILTLSETDHVDMLGLLTLQHVIISSPWPCSLDRIQPVGGALDAFLVDPSDTDGWRSTWSSVKIEGSIVDGATKGFAEVTL